jgi:hypothetical protein
MNPAELGVLALFEMLLLCSRSLSENVKCWILLKPVLGVVDGSLHFTVPSMNRLNQHFQLCGVGLSLGILIFSILSEVWRKGPRRWIINTTWQQNGRQKTNVTCHLPHFDKLPIYMYIRTISILSCVYRTVLQHVPDDFQGFFFYYVSMETIARQLKFIIIIVI